MGEALMLGASHEPNYGKRYADDDLLHWMQECFDASDAHFSTWRSELPGLFSLYGGKTLSEADRKFLQVTERPEIEFNYCLGTLNAILGQDISNKSEVVFRGQDLGPRDQLKGEWLTSGVRRAHQVCKGHLHEWESLWELLISGYGWGRGFLDANQPTILPTLERAPCWEMYPDPDATSTNLTDMRWLIRRRAWTIETIQARWPKEAKDLVGYVTAGSIPVVSHHPVTWNKDEWRKMAMTGAIGRQRVTVTEFEYRRLEPYLRFWNPATETLEEVEESQAEKRWLAMEALGGERPQQVFPYARRCFYRAYAVMSGQGQGVLLEHNKLTAPSFSYQCVTGFRFQDPETGRVIFFGPASVIRDAQHYINKSLRLILELVATSAKGGGFIEESALRGMSLTDFNRGYATPGSFQMLADGTIAEKKIMMKQPTAIPQVIGDFLRLCVEAISTLTGVTDWVKGTASQERSNVLIANLQQQSITMLLPILEPLKEWRSALGVYMARLFLQLPDTIINRIIGEQPVEGLTHTKVPNPETGQSELVPLDLDGNPIERDPMTGELLGEPATPAQILKLDTDPLIYDVVADVGQASPTMKLAVWQVFIQTNLLGTMMEMGAPVDILLPRLLRFLPLPGDMAAELSAEFEARMNRPPQGPEEILASLAQLPEPERMAIIQQAAGAPPPAPTEVAA